MEHKNPPRILKVKDVPDNDKFEGLHPNLPQVPCLMLIIGSVKSGKSNYIINMLCNSDFYKGRFDIVNIISTTLHNDTKGKILEKHFECATSFDESLIEGIKREQGMYDKIDRPTRALILDDCLTHVGGGGLSRNDSISTQSFKAVSTLIRNNANAIIICRLQNQKELEKVMLEYGSLVGGEDNFLSMYNEIHSQPYQLMYIDTAENPCRVFKNHEVQLYP